MLSPSTRSCSRRDCPCHPCRASDIAPAAGRLHRETVYARCEVVVADRTRARCEATVVECAREGRIGLVRRETEARVARLRLHGPAAVDRHGRGAVAWYAGPVRRRGCPLRPRGGEGSGLVTGRVRAPAAPGVPP